MVDARARDAEAKVRANPAVAKWPDAVSTAATLFTSVAGATMRKDCQALGKYGDGSWIVWPGVCDSRNQNESRSEDLIWDLASQS